MDRPEQGYKFSVRGCSVEFQQLAKNAFSKCAFSLSSETIESPLCKVGIVSRFLFRSLVDFQKFLLSVVARMLNYCHFSLRMRVTILSLASLYRA